MADAVGRLLVGREVGALLRGKFFRGNPTTWPAAIDFGEVVQATESCVDELFGALARKWGIDRVKRIKLLHMAPEVKDAVTFVFKVLESPPPVPSRESIKMVLTRSRLRRTAATT